MVDSHSDIMDFPVFPDDLVPKVLQGTDIQRNGWFPWIEGICTDTDNEPLLFVMSLNVGFGGPRARVYVKGQYKEVTFDSAIWTYSNGILTMGSMPKITIDYHHPHHVHVDFDASTHMDFDVTYRGIPLWYGKTTTEADCCRISRNMRGGGYDAPCSISGSITDGITTVSFSGYGDWEHTWLFGPLADWGVIRTKWHIFNDANYCGGYVQSWDEVTGEVICKTGRLTIVGVRDLVFDDYTLTDDGKQPIDSVAFQGTAKDVNGTMQAFVNLASSSFGHTYDGLWTQFALVGTICVFFEIRVVQRLYEFAVKVNRERLITCLNRFFKLKCRQGQAFNGTSWSEYHNNRP